GKSRVLDVCERQHPKVRREDGMYVPILRVTTPSKPTVKGLAEVLLEGMGAVDATRGTENERTRRVKYLMRNTGTEVPGPWPRPLASWSVMPRQSGDWLNG